MENYSKNFSWSNCTSSCWWKRNLRQNFDKSNINYRDGDKQSSKYYDFGSSESDKLKADKEMYNSPKHNVTTDSLGLMVRKYDRSSKRTTLIKWCTSL
jgi:hypothetical protein